METEIGHLGYSITLKSLPPHFLSSIKTELTVKPIENPNFLKSSIAFPVYRLSKNKIYLPRFYGIEKYNNTFVKLNDGSLYFLLEGTTKLVAHVGERMPSTTNVAVAVLEVYIPDASCVAVITVIPAPTIVTVLP